MFSSSVSVITFHQNNYPFSLPISCKLISHAAIYAISQSAPESLTQTIRQPVSHSVMKEGKQLVNVVASMSGSQSVKAACHSGSQVGRQTFRKADRQAK